MNILVIYRHISYVMVTFVCANNYMHKIKLEAGLMSGDWYNGNSCNDRCFGILLVNS